MLLLEQKINCETVRVDNAPMCSIMPKQKNLARVFKIPQPETKKKKKIIGVIGEPKRTTNNVKSVECSLLSQYLEYEYTTIHGVTVIKL